MSLLSSLIIPHLEKELLSHGPEIAEFILSQGKVVGAEIMDWVDKKIEESSQLKKTQVAGQ